MNAGGLTKKDSYGEYDRHLQNLYAILKEKSSMKVVFDNTKKLFPESSQV